MSEKIQARFIIQIAGKPQENVQKALEIVLNKLKEEKKKFKILESDIVEPELEEESTLYSGFIEILARFENINSILEFIADYTPNSIEIEDPEEIVLENNDLTAILNDMSNYLLAAQNQIRKLNAHIHMLNQEKAKK